MKKEVCGLLFFFFFAIDQSYEHDYLGKVKLATILPSKMLSAYFGGQDETSTKALMETASDVQRVIVMIMKEAAGG